MGSLILFVALSGGGSLEYDHGYYPGNSLPWVPLVDKFKVVGTYTTFDKKPALILEYHNGLEIMRLEDFRKHSGSIWINKKKKKLMVFDDSDLNVPFNYEKKK